MSTALRPSVRFRHACLCALVLFAMYARFDFKAAMDLVPTYLAAEFANRGDWDHVYHPTVYIQGDADAAWSARLAELKQRNAGTSFTSHPYYLAIVRPLVHGMNFSTFRNLFFLWTSLAVVWIGAEISRLVEREELPSQLLFTVLVGFADPTIITLKLGQNTLFALALSLAALRLWRGSQPVWMGALFAVGGILCKPWCVLLVAACALLRGFRAGAVLGAVVAVGLWLLPHVLFPARLMQDYIAMNTELGRLSLIAPNNHSILATFDRFLWDGWLPRYMKGDLRHPSLALRLGALGVGGLIVAAAGAALVIRKHHSNWVAATCLALMVVPLGVSWNHYFAFVLPLALLMAFGDHPQRSLRSMGYVLLALCVGLEGLLGYFIRLTGMDLFSSEFLALLTGLPIAVVSGAAIFAAWRAPSSDPSLRSSTASA